MAGIADLITNLKKKLKGGYNTVADALPLVPNTSQIRSFASNPVQYVSNPSYNGGNNLYRTTPFQVSSKVQNYIESPKTFASLVPRINYDMGAKTPTAKIVQDATNFGLNLPIEIAKYVTGNVIDTATDAGANIGRTITGRPLLSYEQAKSPVTRLGYQAANGLLKLKAPTDTKINFKEVVGNIGQEANAILDASTGGLAKNLVNKAVRNLGKETFVQALKRSALEGGLMGTSFGATQGLGDNRKTANDVEYVRNILTSALGGAVAGATLSSAGTAGSRFFGKVMNQLAQSVPKASLRQREVIARQFLRDELGKFTGIKKKGQEPYFYGDMREAMGLPRNGNYQGGFVKLDEPILGISKTQGLPKSTVDPIAALENDIPREQARRANYWNSFNPERAGDQMIIDYKNTLEDAYKEIQKTVKDEKSQAILDDMFVGLREGYKNRYLKYISAKSRTASSAVTGPARFPVEKNRQKMEYAQGVYDEASEFLKKMTFKIKNTIEPTFISSDSKTAVEDLQKKINNLTTQQQLMLSANKIIRSGENVISRLQNELGLSPETAKTLATEKDFMGRIGFPDYQLTSNRNKIKQAQQRLISLDKVKNTQSQSIPFDGGKIDLNPDANRLQIRFNEMPSNEMRVELKRNGYKWSPKEGAWQRQLTENAKYSAKRLFGVDFSAKPVQVSSLSYSQNVIESTPKQTSLEQSKFSPTEMSREEKVLRDQLKRGDITPNQYNEIAVRNESVKPIPVRELQQQGKQVEMLEPVAKQDRQIAKAEAQLRAGAGSDKALTTNDRTKLGQLRKMFERADNEQGSWDVESLKRNNKSLVNWATERWRELQPQKSSLTDDELIDEIYDFTKNNQMSSKVKPETPDTVKTLNQMKEDQKAVARLTGYGEEQYPVRKPKPMTLSDAEKQAKLHEQSIEQTYKTRDASVDELEVILNTPDAELKGGYKMERGNKPTLIIRSKSDEPRTFREIVNKYLGGKQNIKLTQYEQVKPISNVKFTDEGATQAIKAIETGNTTGLSPQAQEYVAKLRKSFDQVRSEAVADGLPIGYVDNYLTHYWEQPIDQVQDVISRLRTSGAFQKERTFLTYQEGIDAGLTPRFQNPTQILGNYVRQVENVRNNLRLIKALEANNFVVSGEARKITPGVREIAIPGFEGRFAKPEVAQFIENLFEPRKANRILDALGRISGKIQDITLSGGIPGTPFNAFSVSANLQKHFLAGRFTGPLKSFARAFSPESTTKYFTENIPAIQEIQVAGYNLPTTLSYKNLMGETKDGLMEKAGEVWDAAVSDPTFKRFIPMLQIDLYKEVKNRALKQGLSAEQAVEKGIQVLRNFEGMSDQFSQKSADPNTQAVARTLFFAPKFRKAIIDIWTNSIKALKNPLALENQYNVRFLAGSLLAFAGYNAANAYFNDGKMMWENGRNKEDKIIIPDGKGGEIGIPFLSSLATIPRGVARQGIKLIKGDVEGAVTDAGQTYLSSGLKPLADVAANQDYFGKTIVDSDSKNKWGDIVGYLGKSYISHPYLRELVDPKNTSDPAYQRLSRAMELPFRFYDAKSVSGSSFYEARDKALEGMSETERKAYDAIPKYDADNPDTQIFKYQTFLTYPGVFEAKRMTEFNLAKQTGKAIDPLYLVNYDTARAYMRYETLPPGSQDRKDLIKAKPELGALFDVRSKYFDENPIEGGNVAVSKRPLPSLYVQQQMDAKNWTDPDVKAYLDANKQYQNEQREKLGLTPLAGYTPYQKKIKVKAMKKIKAPKLKLAKVKNVKYKIPKFKLAKAKAIKLKSLKTKSLMKLKV